MLIRKKLPRAHGVNEPIRHDGSHARPVTRRDFISSGILTGPAVVAAGTMLTMLAKSRNAYAVPCPSDPQKKCLDPDYEAMKADCGFSGVQDGQMIPFICFDLAGGANLNGSEILIGGKGGQLDFLTTAGYGKLGLPGDMVPNAPNAASGTNNFIDTTFGAAFHSDGAILRGMLERTSPATQARVNGTAIAARSENDTGNNPHNPMYGIFKAGASGQLLTLIGSQSSESGGNSAAPIAMVDPSARPTKVDRASDVTGLVDTGELSTLLPDGAAVPVLESMVRMTGGSESMANSNPAKQAAIGTGSKLGKIDFGVRNDAIRQNVKCAYLKSADLANRFGDPSTLNPDLDPDIVDQSTTRGAGIFGAAEYAGDGEFRKTAAVMKMVLNGFAAAGTITMGGYDYHDGTRATGEMRNLRAGRCIGACLEYAARVGSPLMVYVFSDGSLSATNMVDSSVNGRGKFGWQGDNQATASSFFLVFSPNARPTVISADPAGGLGKQIGYFRGDGSVETASHPGANAVNLLVETVILNFLALNGQAQDFPALFPNHGLGSDALRASLTAFNPIV